MVFVAPVGKRNDGNTAAGHEYAAHFDIFGIHEFYEVFHYYINAVLMEIPVVAKAEEIEFQAFAFYHLGSGNIIYYDTTEIGLTCFGAQGSEFGAGERDQILVVGMLVGESLEHLGCIVCRIFNPGRAE